MGTMRPRGAIMADTDNTPTGYTDLRNSQQLPLNDPDTACHMTREPMRHSECQNRLNHLIDSDIHTTDAPRLSLARRKEEQGY